MKKIPYKKPHEGPRTPEERRYLEALHDAIGDTSEETDDNYLAIIRTLIRNQGRRFDDPAI